MGPSVIAFARKIESLTGSKEEIIAALPRHSHQIHEQFLRLVRLGPVGDDDPVDTHIGNVREGPATEHGGVEDTPFGLRVDRLVHDVLHRLAGWRLTVEVSQQRQGMPQNDGIDLAFKYTEES